MVDETALLALTLQQWGQWMYADIRPSDAATELDHLNKTQRTIVLFRYADGVVQILPKPEFFTVEEMELGQQPIPMRAQMYRRLLEEAADRLPGHTIFAIQLEDGDFPTQDVPIFAFQKIVGSNNVLLPDVDFIVHDFYQAESFEDQSPYTAKADRGIFVGSTTGMPITRDVLSQGLSPRVQAGLYFRNHPIVDFRLPNIVMCDSTDIEDELRALGFGGEGASWQDQFGYKYLLSMDGNGATCSRVAIALKSNCVLLKYNSVYQLHYFSLLQPWRHYIPIAANHEVEKIIYLEKANPGLFGFIARNSGELFREILTKDGILAYTRMLFTIYLQSGPRFDVGAFDCTALKS